MAHRTNKGNTAPASTQSGRGGLVSMSSLPTLLEANKSVEEFYELEPVEVLEVLLKEPMVNGKVDYKYVGAIKGRFIYSESGKAIDDCNYFLPINPNITTLPVVGEVVIGVFYLKNFFYTTQLNFFGSPNVNHQIGLSDGDVENVNKSEVEKEVEIGKHGVFYKPNFEIRKQLPKEGDVIIEGRYGNSIRLSSNIMGSPDETPPLPEKENSPNIILTAGHLINNEDSEQLKEENDAPIVENIDEDGSSIYLTTDQQLIFTPAIESPVETLFAPFEGKNILLDSDRIILNTKNQGSIGLFSSKNISIGAIEKVVIEAPEVKIGSDDAVEPLVLGDALKQVLTDILTIIESGLLAPTGPVVPGPGAALLATLKATGLDSILSKKNKVD